MSGTPVPVRTLHEAFGTLLVGTWFNVLLFTLTITQQWRYWTTYSKDVWWIRSIVVSMFFTDLLAVAALCAMGYLYVITGWGDVVAMGSQNACFPIYVATTAVNVFTMHMFLLHRYTVLSKNWIVASLLSLTALTAAVGGFVVTWAVNHFSKMEDRSKLKTFVTVWLVAAVAADLLIAIALIFELARVKSAFKQTRSLIRRLIRTSVASGSFTAALAILALTTYLASPTTNTCLMFAMLIGRTASITVLYNVNERRSQQSGSSAGTTIPLDTKGHGGTGMAGGIGVHQMSVVHVDAQSGRTDFDTGSYDKRGGEIV